MNKEKKQEPPVQVRADQTTKAILSQHPYRENPSFYLKLGLGVLYVIENKVKRFFPKVYDAIFEHQIIKDIQSKRRK